MAIRRIGIVGGVGPAATILYYRGLTEGYRRLSGGRGYPELIVYSLDLDEVNGLFEAGRLDDLARLVAGAAGLLERGGCGLGLFSCNAMHLVFDRVKAIVELPLINLIEAVVGAVQSRGAARVGLIGTTFAMRSGLYAAPLAAAGMDCLLPAETDQDWIMAAILDDLQRPVIPAATVGRLLSIIDELGRRGAEGIILGCTDLPAAVSPENSPLPVLDSAAIHIEAVLARALAGDRQ